MFLSARLVTRYADKYEPHLASAFQKLEEGLPDALREHVERTLDDLAARRVDEDFNRHVEDLTRAWAERRVVRFRYAPARYDGTEREPRWAEVAPVPARAVAGDPRAVPDRPRRDARRHADVQGRADHRPLADAADLRGPGGRRARRHAAAGLGHHRGPAARRRSCCASIPRSAHACARRPGIRARRSAKPRTGRSSGAPGSPGTIEIRLWILSWGDEVEVLAPQDLREDVAGTLTRAIARYS